MLVLRVQDHEYPLDARMPRERRQRMPQQWPAVQREVLLGRVAPEAGAEAGGRHQGEVAGHVAIILAGAKGRQEKGGRPQDGGTAEAARVMEAIGERCSTNCNRSVEGERPQADVPGRPSSMA
jgi:hypothetical protein